MLYEMADHRDLPVEVRGEAVGPGYYARARHRAAVPDEPVDRVSDEERFWPCYGPVGQHVIG
ncbi:hypothetical protein [Streptomyces sp. NPDC051992]